MRNYIFVSNESFDKLTTFYFTHLTTKKEKYEVFAKPMNLLNINSKRVVFLLEKNHTKNLEEIYNQITELNKVDIKSTIITEQIEENILQKFSQLNAMVLLSEVPAESHEEGDINEDSSGSLIAVNSGKLKINFFNKIKNYFNLFFVTKKSSFELLQGHCKSAFYYCTNLYFMRRHKTL